MHTAELAPERARTPWSDEDVSALHAVPPPLAPSAPARPFVGRERELATLRAELAAAAEGDGRLVLLTGEDGIGKTRTAQALAATARDRGFDVLWASAVEDDPTEYGPWLQVMRGLTALRAGHPSRDSEPGSPDPAEWVRSVCETAARGPLLIVLDDLHATDPGSLALLRSLAARLEGTRLAIVGTIRTGELASPDTMHRVPATRRIPLAGLDEAAIASWVAVAAGGAADSSIVAALARRSGGNPFFIGELIELLGRKDGAPVIPDGVRAVARRRLAHVSPDCTCLLRLIAVIGEECAQPVVERVVAPSSVDVLALLDEAVREGILDERPGRPGRWRFTHGLIQEALYDELDGRTRARLHHAVAGALVALHTQATDPPAAAIARHFFLAATIGCAGQAAAWSERAAAQANARWEWEDAGRHFGGALDALELAPPVDARKRAELLLALGEARSRAGDAEAARRAVLAAADLAAHLALPDVLVRAALQFRGGQFSLSLGVDREHVRLLEATLDTLGDRAPALRARVLAKLALEGLAGGDAGAHDALSAQALALARDSGDRSAIAAAGTSRHWGLLGSVDLQERQALARETLRAARALGDPDKVVAAIFQVLVDLVEQGDLRGARRLLHDARLGERLPIDVEYWRAILRGFELLMRGQLADADRAIDTVSALAGRVRPDHDVASVVFGQRSVLRREQGRLAEMEPQMGLQIDSHPRRFLCEAGLALLHAQIGRVPEAREALRRLVARDLDRLAPDGFLLPTVTMLAELSALLHDTGAARVLHARLAPYGTRAVVLGHLAAYWGCSATYLGLLAGELGGVDEAEHHFAAALAFDEGLGAVPWTARTRCHWAELLLARNGPGDRSRAATLAAAAVDIADRLGMPVVLERAVGLELAARGRAPAGHVATSSPQVAPSTGILLRDGEVWTLGWNGQVARMRDTKGLRYLARLLACAGEPLLALDLAAEGADLDGADPAAAERARSTVTQRIRGALRRISPQMPALAEHLLVRIRTGTRCIYLCDSSRPVRWIV